jgi:hypothetical protein
MDRMSIYIDLFHGPHHPEEQLDDWGFQGPILGPFPFFHMTYGNDIKIGDTDGIVVASVLLELPAQDKNGFIVFLGSHYGDISIFSEETLKESLELIARLGRTQEVFKIPERDMAMLINDSEEWVKHYAKHVIGGIE